jgi:Gpi18-like mannosyltransferase
MQLAAIGAVAFYLHAICWATVPPDLKLYLFPWYKHILDYGPVAAFAEPFSNYTPTYLYLLAAVSLADPVLSPLAVIKLLSLAGTAFLAAALADLLGALGTDPKRAFLIFVLPTAVLNAALLGQCDALWAGSCVLAVAAMIRGRTTAALVWCGVAIAFKAQSAFIAPFVIGGLIGWRTPLWRWAIPPVVFVGLMLPAWLIGWPAQDLALVYVRQVQFFEFPGNLANPWIWGTQYAPELAQRLYPFGYAAAAGAALAIGALAAGSIRKPRAMLALALISAMAMPFLLPKMHERYMFLADVLALAVVLAHPSRATVVLAVAVQLTSLSALTSYIYHWPPPALVGAFIGGIALIAIGLHARAEGACWSQRRAGSLFPA